MNVEYPTQITLPSKAALIFRELFRDADREMMAVLTLDTKNKVIGCNVVTVGTLNSSLVHPREIFKMAILQNANGIIHGHNHPSGDPSPSKEDLNVNKLLTESGTWLSIKVLDGIVCGDAMFYSIMNGSTELYPLNSNLANQTF